MKSAGLRPTTSSSEYSITRVKLSLTHSMVPSGEPMRTGLSVLEATRERLRASAWLARRASSASRGAVMSWTVPMMREGRWSGPEATVLDRV